MDEFESTMAITLLQGVEAVRRCPTMFLQGADAPERLHWLVAQVFRAAVLPTHRNGARRVVVTLYKDEGLTIADDGVGIPVEPVEYSGVHHPRLHVMMLTLFSGGQPTPEFFDLWGYLFLHGPIIAACSKKLTIRTIRGGAAYRASFEEGGLTGLLSRAYGTEERGTRLTFSPTPALFDGKLLERPRLEQIVTQLRQEAGDVEIVLETSPTCRWD